MYIKGSCCTYITDILWGGEGEAEVKLCTFCINMKCSVCISDYTHRKACSKCRNRDRLLNICLFSIAEVIKKELKKKKSGTGQLRGAQL